MQDATRYTLMKLLESEPDISQRELANRMGISLGKTNYCLKALMSKGFVKLRNFKNSHNKLRYAYFLTPSGIEEKARITAAYLRLKEAEYERIRQEIEQLRLEARENAT